MNPLRNFYLSAVLSAVVFFPGATVALQLDAFVIFGQESVKIGRDATVDSGHVGSNVIVAIDQNARIKAHVYGGNVVLNGNVSIGGDVIDNRLGKKNGATAGDNTTAPIELPVASIPTIAQFRPGVTDLAVPAHRSMTIRPAAYNVLRIGRRSRVVFSGGFYNLHSLLVDTGARITFSAPTTINVAYRLEIGSDCFVSGPTIRAREVSINYAGDRDVRFGFNSVVHAKVYATQVHLSLGDGGRYRGLFAAKSVQVGKEARLGLEAAFSLPPDLDAFVVDEHGSIFLANEILVLLTREGTWVDAEAIAASVGGSIIGFVPTINLYRILVTSETSDELNALIDALTASENPVIKQVFKNVAYESGGQLNRSSPEPESVL